MDNSESLSSDIVLLQLLFINFCFENDLAAVATITDSLTKEKVKEVTLSRFFTNNVNMVTNLSKTKNGNPLSKSSEAEQKCCQDEVLNSKNQPRFPSEFTPNCSESSDLHTNAFVIRSERLSKVTLSEIKIGNDISNSENKNSKTDQRNPALKGFTIEETNTSIEILRMIHQKINELKPNLVNKELKEESNIRKKYNRKTKTNSEKQSKKNTNSKNSAKNKNKNLLNHDSLNLRNSKKTSHDKESVRNKPNSSRYNTELKGFTSKEVETSKEINEKIQKAIENKINSDSKKAINLKKVNLKKLQRLSFIKRHSTSRNFPKQELTQSQVDKYESIAEITKKLEPIIKVQENSYSDIYKNSSPNTNIEEFNPENMKQEILDENDIEDNPEIENQGSLDQNKHKEPLESSDKNQTGFPNGFTAIKIEPNITNESQNYQNIEQLSHERKTVVDQRHDTKICIIKQENSEISEAGTSGNSVDNIKTETNKIAYENTDKHYCTCSSRNVIKNEDPDFDFKTPEDQDIKVSYHKTSFGCTCFLGNQTSKIESKTDIKNTITNTSIKDCDDTPKPNPVNPKWHPPRSPHNLIEEILYHDPWALLVATIFLNKTSCMCARPYILEFLKDYRSPFEVLETEPCKLEKYFANIGLKKRAVQVWRMSHDFIHKNWKNVKELYGIGKYGEDAYRMFCVGDFSVEPKDRFLKIYKAWYEMIEKKNRMLEVNSFKNSGSNCNLDGAENVT